jgi:hypothetical protein
MRFILQTSHPDAVPPSYSHPRGLAREERYGNPPATTNHTGALATSRTSRVSMMSQPFTLTCPTAPTASWRNLPSVTYVLDEYMQLPQRCGGCTIQT